MPPNGFTAIKDATVHKSVVSLIGVIVSIQPPKKSKGTDWVLEITIQDDFTTGVIGMESSIKCRLFRPKPDLFPKINGVGDVALLRNFMLNEWMLRMDACWKTNSGVLVFPASGIPAPEFSEPIQSRSQKLPSFAVPSTREATLEEQMEVIQLKYAASSLLSQVKQFAATALAPSAVHDKRSLIKDVEIDKFYDIRAEVVNLYYKDGTVDLKVTDYTANESLYLYVDADDELYSYQEDKLWKGPYGKLTMNVLLYESNALWARENVKEGDFVVLRNMRTKLSPKSFLEGVLHQDRFRPDQVDIRILYTASEVRLLQARKDQYEKEYEKKHAKKSALENLQNEPKKPSAKVSASKRAEKRARQRAQKEQEQKEIQEQAEQWDVVRNGLNNNIYAAHPDIQLSTLSEIIHNPHLNSRTPKYNDFTFPFLNVRHRSRVRVVDFFPPELEQFAHSLSNPHWEKRARKPAPNDSSSKPRWEWGFVLLLEDAKIPPNTVSEKLRVVVGNDAAQYLLDMNARDLTRDEETLKKLEEKLFILWGNLLELKTELRDKGNDMPLPPGDNRLQNKVFDCLIEEYGYEVAMSEKHPEGFQRMHRLVQTRIMSNL